MPNSEMHLLIANQKTILENQALILKGQEEIKNSQAAVIRNQGEILAGQRHCMYRDAWEERLVREQIKAATDGQLPTQH